MLIIDIQNHRYFDWSPMDAPNFEKYDKVQLRQILGRIDRRRFPERVKKIEARLATLELASLSERPLETYSTGVDEQSVKGLNRGGQEKVKWLVACMLLVTLIVGAFAVRSTSEARKEWFEYQARMDKYGVVADAVVIEKLCSSKVLMYRWRWEGKDFRGSSRPCDGSCSKANIGDKSLIRFMPANPAFFRCEAIKRAVLPSYIDPVILVLFFVWAIFWPFIRLAGDL